MKKTEYEVNAHFKSFHLGNIEKATYRPPKCGETPPLDDCESSMLLIFDQSIQALQQKKLHYKETKKCVGWPEMK